MLALRELENSFANEIHRKDIMPKENSLSRIDLSITAQLKRYEYIKTRVGYLYYYPIQLAFLNKYKEELKGKFGWFYEKMHFDIITTIQDIDKYLLQLKLFSTYYDILSGENHMEVELKLFICFYYAFIHNVVIDKVTDRDVYNFTHDYYILLNENIRQFAPDIEEYRKWLGE